MMICRSTCTGISKNYRRQLRTSEIYCWQEPSTCMSRPGCFISFADIGLLLCPYLSSRSHAFVPPANNCSFFFLLLLHFLFGVSGVTTSGVFSLVSEWV